MNDTIFEEDNYHYPNHWLAPYPLYRVKDVFYLMTNLVELEDETSDTSINLVVFDKDSFILHIQLWKFRVRRPEDFSNFTIFF